MQCARACTLERRGIILAKLNGAKDTIFLAFPNHRREMPPYLYFFIMGFAIAS